MTCYIAAGTQASSGEKNKLMLIKLSDLSRTKFDDEEEAEDEDDSDVDDDATLTHKAIPHRGGVNRIRVRAWGGSDGGTAHRSTCSACRSSRT